MHTHRYTWTHTHRYTHTDIHTQIHMDTHKNTHVTTQNPHRPVDECVFLDVGVRVRVRVRSGSRWGSNSVVRLIK